jgi:hypothetical protein
MKAAFWRFGISAGSLVAYLGGLGCATYGFWLIFHPLGWIVGGILLFGIALLIDRERSHESR